MTESLTDEERVHMAVHHPETLRTLNAQAAALGRVRAEIARTGADLALFTLDAHEARQRIGACGYYAIRKALAAAPEHTNIDHDEWEREFAIKAGIATPEHTGRKFVCKCGFSTNDGREVEEWQCPACGACVWATCRTCAAPLDRETGQCAAPEHAATKHSPLGLIFERIEELKGEVRVHRDRALERTKEREAANARADAAERQGNDVHEMNLYLAGKLALAESERDEWKAKCEAAEEKCHEAELELDEVQRRLDTVHSGHIACKQAWVAKEAALQSELAEAKAKCEAAFACAKRDGDHAVRAESEAASLRAELSNTASLQQFQMVSAECETLRAEVEHLRGEHLHPCGAREAEIVSLRAEVERATEQAVLFRVECERLESRLSTATELLKVDDVLWSQWRSEDITADEDRWVSFTDRAHTHHDAVVAFLQTTAPAPTERLAAERAVLEALAEVPYHWLSKHTDSPHRDVRDFAAAELARRAGKG